MQYSGNKLGCLHKTLSFPALKLRDKFEVKDGSRKQSIFRPHFLSLGVKENFYGGFVLHFRVKCDSNDILVLVQAIFMQSCSL